MNQNNNQNSNQNGGHAKKDNTMTISIVVVIIVILLAIIIGHAMKKSSASVVAPNEAVVTPSATTTEMTASTSPSYQQMLETYAGKTIAFNQSCEAVPTSYTFPAGTRVLFANDSSGDKTIIYETTKIMLKPYHYMTVALTTAGSYPLKCNEVVNAGSIEVTQ